MKVAMLVAAGTGTRMGTDKLWLNVDGLPIVGHAWRRYDGSSEVDAIVLVIRPEKREAFEALAPQLGLNKPFKLVEGGQERQDSVWSGLNACPSGTRWVAIADAARPCTASQLIEDCYRQAQAHGAVVAASRVTDTLKRVTDSEISDTVDRDGLWAVQTPQVFSFELIFKALEQVRGSGYSFTDDTAACQHVGIPVRVVESGAPNPKVTFPGDLPYVRWLLANPTEDA
jgi:2-C-methyl-D-erythritol 4-phosphate cytidylyltransferase